MKAKKKDETLERHESLMDGYLEEAKRLGEGAKEQVRRLRLGEANGSAEQGAEYKVGDSRRRIK